MRAVVFAESDERASSFIFPTSDSVRRVRGVLVLKIYVFRTSGHVVCAKTVGEKAKKSHQKSLYVAESLGKEIAIVATIKYETLVRASLLLLSESGEKEEGRDRENYKIIDNFFSHELSFFL